MAVDGNLDGNPDESLHTLADLYTSID